MTAVEKAKELVLKMVDTYNVTSDFCYDSTAKACALIAVDEVMGAIDAEDHVILYNYWQQVKTEIENL